MRNNKRKLKQVKEAKHPVGHEARHEENAKRAFDYTLASVFGTVDPDDDPSETPESCGSSSSASSLPALGSAHSFTASDASKITLGDIPATTSLFSNFSALNPDALFPLATTAVSHILAYRFQASMAAPPRAMSPSIPGQAPSSDIAQVEEFPALAASAGAGASPARADDDLLAPHSNQNHRVGILTAQLASPAKNAFLALMTSNSNIFRSPPRAVSAESKAASAARTDAFLKEVTEEIKAPDFSATR